MKELLGVCYFLPSEINEEYEERGERKEGR